MNQEFRFTREALRTGLPLATERHGSMVVFSHNGEDHIATFYHRLREDGTTEEQFDVYKHVFREAK